MHPRLLGPDPGHHRQLHLWSRFELRQPITDAQRARPGLRPGRLTYNLLKISGGAARI